MTKEVLSKELNEAINKNLPHMVGEELKSVLAKAELDANDLATTKATLEVRDKLIKEQKQDIGELSGKISKLEALVARKEAVEERERNLRVTLSEQSVLNEREKTKQMFDILGLVFRNQQLMRSTLSNTPVPYQTGSAGGCISTYVQNHAHTEAISEEVK